MGHIHSGNFEELAASFPAAMTAKDFAGDERPAHRVRIKRAFWISKGEVTLGMFRRFVVSTGYRTTAERSGEGAVGFAPPSEEERKRGAGERVFRRSPTVTWKNPGFSQTDDHPVTCVSYQDAVEFCAWLSKLQESAYRLPSEAEWEYACRGGTKTFFSFGNDAREIHLHANIADVTLERLHPGVAMRQWLVNLRTSPSDGFAFTAPCGGMTANRFGLHDVHGNVWEWCEDRYRSDAYKRAQPVVSPVVRESQDNHADWRVIRGGGWNTGPTLARSATRAFFDSADAACYLGFRVVREDK